jgi:excisionase family DNA binding protein
MFYWVKGNWRKSPVRGRGEKYWEIRTDGNRIQMHSLDSRLLTAPDAARILNISKGGAYQLIQQRKMPSVRFNSNVRVRKTSTNWPPNAQSRYSKFHT